MSTCFEKSVPKLQATKIDGNPLDWMKWFSTFPATIDRSPMSLSKKMINLQSLLTGEAKSLIDGYGCNGSLYVPALNCLEEHFGNPNRIVNAFLDKLSQFKPPNLTVPESYTQFSAFLLTLVDIFQQVGFNHDIHSNRKPQSGVTNFRHQSAWTGTSISSKSFYSSRLLKTFLIGYQSTQWLVEICQRQYL